MQKKKFDVKARVEKKTYLSERFCLLSVKAPLIAEHALPGQFVNVKVQEKTTDPLLRVPLAVHDTNEDSIALYFKKAGKSTELLSEKKEKDDIRILGPLGNGFDLSSTGKTVLLVCGGHGAAPMFFAARRLLEKGKEVHLFLGGDTADTVLIAERFRELGVKIHIATEDGTCGQKGYVTCALETFLSGNIEQLDVLACGPRAMLKAVRAFKKDGLKMQFSMDAYMACGIGACQGCVVETKKGYKLACTDGPVFDAEEIIL